MTSVRSCLAIATLLVAFTLDISPSTGASTVQKTKDDCVTAWATLMSSHPTIHGSFPHAEYKEAILKVTGPSTGFAAGRSQSFDLFTFDTRFLEGGTAYVAHCGSGATCNGLGDALVKRYPESGTVYVHCVIEPPHVLDNPQSF